MGLPLLKTEIANKTFQKRKTSNAILWALRHMLSGSPEYSFGRTLSLLAFINAIGWVWFTLWHTVHNPGGPSWPNFESLGFFVALMFGITKVSDVVMQKFGGSATPPPATPPAAPPATPPGEGK